MKIGIFHWNCDILCWFTNLWQKKTTKSLKQKLIAKKFPLCFIIWINRLRKCVRIDGIWYRCISDFNPSAANKISRFQPFFKPYYLEMNSGNIFSMKHISFRTDTKSGGLCRKIDHITFMVQNMRAFFFCLKKQTNKLWSVRLWITQFRVNDC